MQAEPRIARVVLGAVVALTAACSGDRLLTLGRAMPLTYHFGTPKLVAELASTARTDNPTLTADQLEIYFTSGRDGSNSGSGDIWFARRTSTTAPWDAPLPAEGVNLDSFETSSAISADGLTLWFGSDRAGGVGSADIWVSTRPTRASAWSPPTNLIALNTVAEDIPRPPGEHGLVMPLASTQAGRANYQTYLARRGTPGAPFGKPVLVEELAFSNRSTVDGCLTDDGLAMFFTSGLLMGDGGADVDGGVPVKADLFVAYRPSTDERFVMMQPLSELNTVDAEERDPWLTADGKTLYFTSDRTGVLSIYTAAVELR